MSLFSSKTPEQQAAERAEKDHAKWLLTPPGQARLSYQRGDLLFQAAIDLADHDGHVHTLATLSPRGSGPHTVTRAADVSAVLNEILAEGWDFVTGTVVFVPTTQESRDKFFASGQQVAVSGRTVGYYLFRRRP